MSGLASFLGLLLAGLGGKEMADRDKALLDATIQEKKDEAEYKKGHLTETRRANDLMDARERFLEELRQKAAGERTDKEQTGATTRTGMEQEGAWKRSLLQDKGETDRANLRINAEKEISGLDRASRERVSIAENELKKYGIDMEHVYLMSKMAKVDIPTVQAHLLNSQGNALSGVGAILSPLLAQTGGMEGVFTNRLLPGTMKNRWNLVRTLLGARGVKLPEMTDKDFGVETTPQIPSAGVSSSGRIRLPITPGASPQSILEGFGTLMSKNPDATGDELKRVRDEIEAEVPGSGALVDNYMKQNYPGLYGTGWQ